MPFKSRSQLQTCFGRSRKSKRSNWNCNEWLRETPSVCCLPYREGDKVKSRCMRKGERIVGKVRTGPKGGKFFTITEKDSKGTLCTIKVYVKK